MTNINSKDNGKHCSVCDKHIKCGEDVYIITKRRIGDQFASMLYGYLYFCTKCFEENAGPGCIPEDIRDEQDEQNKDQNCRP